MSVNKMLKISGLLKLPVFASDPSNAENGAMYYNSATGKFRQYASGAWLDVIAGSVPFIGQPLDDGKIIIGNSSNESVAVTPSGDATISNSGVISIGANKVTNSQLAQMPASTIKGNNTGGTANADDLTSTEVTAMLNAFSGDSGSGGVKGLVPAPSSGDAAAGKYLSADGGFSVPELFNDGSPQLSANLDANSHKITNLSAGTSANDAINKDQLDDVVTDLQSNLDDHINETVGAHAASAISVSPAVNSTTTVQAALENHESRIDSLEVGGGDTKQVKISSNDTTEGYLEDKIVGASGKIAISTLNDGGNEDLQITIGSDVFDKTTDDAGDVSYSNATSGLAASNVQGAIDEVEGRLDTVETKAANLVTLSGVASGSTNLGTFSGTTIADSSTVKNALQDLETAHETTDELATDLVSLSGMSANSINLGTFTGTTIADNSTVKGALQSLETAVEEVNQDAADFATLSGVAENSTDLGTFTGTTIADGSTIKGALQSLETSQEEIDQNANDLISLTGVSENSTSLGSFTGTTIADGSTIKAALQDLETAVEEVNQDAADLATLSGVAENSTDLGTFTGTTIADSSTVKSALQDLETAHEDHINETLGAHAASAIAVNPTGNLDSGNVQDALEELQGDIDSISTTIGGDFVNVIGDTMTGDLTMGAGADINLGTNAIQASATLGAPSITFPFSNKIKLSSDYDIELDTPSNILLGDQIKVDSNDKLISPNGIQSNTAGDAKLNFPVTDKASIEAADIDLLASDAIKITSASGIELSHSSLGSIVTVKSDMSMDSHKVTNLAAATGNGEAVRYEQAVLTDGSNSVTGDLSFSNSAKIVDLVDPLDAQDAATKAYVDNKIAGLSWKEAVHVASAVGENVNISSAPSMIDNHTLSSGERVLLKNQTTASQNGIYDFNGAGNAMTRSSDANTWDELFGAVVYVQNGDENAGSKWVNSSPQSGTLGSDPITWAIFSAATALEGSGTTNHVAYWSSGSVLTSEAHLSASRGGLGTDGSIFNGVVKASSGVFSASAIVNADVDAAAAIEYSKLDLNDSIVDSDIAVGAAIDRAKLDSGVAYAWVNNNSSGVMSETSVTADRAVVSDANGLPSASATTATQIGYLSSTTSNVQDQLDAKLENIVEDTTPQLGGDLDLNGHAISSPLKVGSSSEFFEESYIHNLTLLASQTDTTLTALTFAHATYMALDIQYTIKEATTNSVRVGNLRIVTNGTDIGISDDYADSADVGVSWNAAISGSNVVVQYSTTANGKTFRASVKKFMA